MITFIPLWENTSNMRESVDDLIGQIRSFILLKKSYRILVSDYIPNLRYFLHRFDLLESNYLSIFDELQGFKDKNQKHISLKDLNFHDNASFIYSTYYILVFENKEIIGKVILGEGGHISEVHHLKNSLLTMVEIYDDRGFISSRKYYSERKLDYTIYLDSNEEEIFVEYNSQGDCVVNLENSHGLKSLYYDDIEKIKFEIIELNLLKYKSEKIIISISNKNLNFINSSKQINKMVFSVFKNHYHHIESLDEEFKESISKSRGVMFDSDTYLPIFNTLEVSSKKLHKVTPYDTRFNLSTTQEIKEEIIYFDARDLHSDTFCLVMKYIINYFNQEIVIEQTNRKFKLIVRVDQNKESESFKIINEILSNLFPDEISQINNNIDNEILKQITPKVLLVNSLIQSIELKVIWTEEEFFKIMDQTRLIVDLSDEPDLFTQMAGISAGLPQINAKETEYVEHKKNGIILVEIFHLEMYLRYYLDELQHWQEARAFTIHKIKNYSSIRLSQNIENIFSGEK